MGSALDSHEAMSEEMERLRLERDSLKKIVNDDVLAALTTEQRKNKTLEERLVIMTGKLAQAMSGVVSTDYSS